MATEAQTLEVRLICPDCEALIVVPILVEIATDDRGVQRIRATPDEQPAWDHALSHMDVSGD